MHTASATGRLTLHTSSWSPISTALGPGASSRFRIKVLPQPVFGTDQAYDVSASVAMPGDVNAANNSATDHTVSLAQPVPQPGGGPVTFSFNATEGMPYSGPIGLCPAGVSAVGATDIFWGDGTSSASAGPGGGLQIIGMHTYAVSGVFQIQMTCTVLTPNGIGGFTPIPVLAGTQAIVSHAPQSPIQPLPQNPVVEGTASTVTVASFLDSNSSAAAGDFEATVAYSDTDEVSCAVVPSSLGIPGAFDVRCFRFWPDAGLYQPYLVRVKDVRGLGGWPVAFGKQFVPTVEVTEASLSGSGIDNQLVANAPTTFAGQVAQFSDANVAALLSDLTATINWGDGTPASAGQVAILGGGFTVSGSHTYAADGAYKVTTTITDSNVSNLILTSTLTITAPLVPPCTLDCTPPKSVATPELDSVLLFGSGLTGLGAYALRRLRARPRRQETPQY